MSVPAVKNKTLPANKKRYGTAPRASAFKTEKEEMGTFSFIRRSYHSTQLFFHMIFTAEPLVCAHGNRRKSPVVSRVFPSPRRRSIKAVRLLSLQRTRLPAQAGPSSISATQAHLHEKSSGFDPPTKRGLCFEGALWLRVSGKAR